MRLVDADALCEYANNQKSKTVDANDIMRFPMVDAAPVMHARWQKASPFTDTEECSNCKYNIPTDEFETPCCPWCGAKMDGGDEHGKKAD